MPRGFIPEQRGEDGGRVRIGCAEPVDRAIGGEQRYRLPVGEHDVFLDGCRMTPQQPALAQFRQGDHEFGDIGRGIDAPARRGLALSDLDSHIWAGQAREDGFVGDVVAHEEDGRSTHAMTQQVDRIGLLRVDHAEFDDLLAVPD